MKSVTKDAEELLKLRNLLNYKIDNDKLAFFKRDIKKYRESILKAEEKEESEEHCKGILKDFFSHSFGYNCNTNQKIDLVIKHDDIIKTIIETKNYKNKEEMIKENDYNHKAFYQSIFYYYKSRNSRNNKDFNIDNIIITNYEDAYLFIKDDFEKIINDKQIINYFNDNKRIKSETFYKICGSFLDKINTDAVGYKINLFNDDDEIIYRFFNSYNICSLKLQNDYNSISNTFYREIIYIMGLKEKKFKESKSSGEIELTDNDNTLMKLTIKAVKKYYSNENEIKETALKLNILWINRILFLKILEAQLRVFKNDNNVNILNHNEIRDYSFLNTLFFDVLAKSRDKRKEDGLNYKYYDHIPYLNSSLFEETEEEQRCSISKLDNISKMKIMSGSILYNDRGFNEKQLTCLEYMLRFLNCYVFNSDSDNADKNTVIKSSVLGLVFERLNGYKDGSHFTPPAITMYMSKYSIEKIIIEKFNKYFTDTHFNNINEVKKYVNANIHIYGDDFKYILDSIKIIDPACGSGHFLVSCLNELMRIKSEFGFIHKTIEISIKNDELDIDYIDGSDFSYKIKDDILTERQQEIQKILFNAKKHIIDSQLYGADINPNSVNICRLRLWIELLKSSYYTDIESSEKYTDLAALPNLEFKILSADSLLWIKNDDDMLFKFDKNELIKNMHDYFNSNSEEKQYIREKVINLIKNIDDLSDYNPFDMLRSYDFFDSGIMFGIDKFDIVIMNPPYFQLTGNHKYSDYFDNKESKAADIYQLFMEMTFNKLIDEGGIVSAVISNKWMRAGYGGRTRKFLYNKAHVFEVIDLGANWFENAAVDTNIISYGKRKADMQEKINAYKISLCDDIISSKKDKLSGVEKERFIYPKKDNSSWIILNEDEKSVLEKIHRFKALKDWGINIYRGVLTGFNEAFIIDEAAKERLIKEDKKSAEIIRPLLRGRDIKRYYYDYNNLYLINVHNGLKHKDIAPININDYPAVKKHLDKYYKQLEKRQDKGDTPYNLRNCAYLEDFDKPKLIYPETATSANFYYDEENFIPDKTNFIMTGEHLKYIMSVLSSKLGFYIFYNFYSNIELGEKGFQYRKDSIELFPIPEPDHDTESKLIKLIDDIVQLKKDKNDTSDIESDADRIVYSLYGLNDDEIKIIEGC